MNGEENLKNTWRILNKYTHFTYTFIETTLNNPDFTFFEKMNEELFKKCFEVYFSTMDLFYLVLCWRFPHIRKKMKEVIKWWNVNYKWYFKLTKRMVNQDE